MKNKVSLLIQKLTLPGFHWQANEHSLKSFRLEYEEEVKKKRAKEEAKLKRQEEMSKRQAQMQKEAQSQRREAAEKKWRDRKAEDEKSKRGR